MGNTEIETSEADQNTENHSLTEQIVALEWEQFQKVNNEGGRADCQDNYPTFHIMRCAQFDTWPVPVRESYLQDLQDAEACGRNLVMEKYARMMSSTAPDRYREIEPLLPAVSEELRAVAEMIIGIHKTWMAEHASRYPGLTGRGRYLYSSDDTPWDTSSETYLRGELLTYSERTLDLLLDFDLQARKDGINLVDSQDSLMVKSYGYADLEEAEKAQHTV